MKVKAVLITIMDVSGSMGYTKKKLAREYFNLFKGMLNSRYDDGVETVFVSHTTKAEESQSIFELIDKSQSGGTYISTGVRKAVDIAKERYNHYEYDIYTINFSDGDNWVEDNENTINYLNELTNMSTLSQFVEIKMSTYISTISKIIEDECSRVSVLRLHSKNDMINSFVEVYKSQDKMISKMNEIRKNDQSRLDGNVVDIVRNTGYTVVKLKDGCCGESYCNPSDVYDDAIGFEVAKLRAEITSKENKLKSYTR